ncbi:MAG: hypothetical protein WCO03_00670 [bacterium]
MKENFNDPKIQAKLHLYFDLIERDFSAELVALDVPLPSCADAGYCYADIVIFRDLDHSLADLVIECLPEAASDSDIDQAKKVAAIKGAALRSREVAYAVGLEICRL